MIDASKPKRINVALQGGGAHGAFTWGVLDRLLEDDRIETEAISGTSAGAMNGVVMAEGLVEGGRARARAQLAAFWRAVSDSMAGSRMAVTAWNGFFPSWLTNANPAFAAMQSMAQNTSPYQFNPLDFNPLRDIVASEVDFKRVHQCDAMKLFIAATNVVTGRVEVFTGDRITLDSVMASACLPTLYKAVEIDGVPYWDGGYVGNPVLQPFFDACTSSDLLIVQINPDHRAGTPHETHAILDRLNEITFNASLLREIDSIKLINKHLRNGRLKGVGYRDMRLHRIGGGKVAEGWTVASKLDSSWELFGKLFMQGRTETDTWIRKHFDDIGERDSMKDE
jgi:NTE family protein